MVRCNVACVIVVAFCVMIAPAAFAAETKPVEEPKKEPAAKEAPALIPIAPAAKPGDEPPKVKLSGRELVVERGADRKSLILPCTPGKHVVHNDVVYVACGPDGVAMVSLSGLGAPRLLKHADPGGDVQGFTIVDEQVWAIIVRQEARPVDLSPIRLAPPAPKAAYSETATALMGATPLPAKVGDVIGQKGGRVTISLGSADGLRTDQRVEIFREHEVVLGEGQRAVREETLAVGRVAAVSEKAAQVDLGTDELVRAGSKVRATTRDLTANRLFPPRMAEVWDFNFMLRPFLALGTVGVGMVSDAAVGYRFKEPVHIQLLLKPFGVGLAGDGNIVAEAANLVGSYDTSYFEIGLGLGWSAVNNPIEESALSSDEAAGIGASVPRFEKVRDGLSIAQMARLGSLDGMHLHVDNFFVLYKGEFQYGGTIGSIQTPIGDRSWLLLRGGGGVAGYAFGEIGLRVLVRGNGGPGALFLTPSLGGAALMGEKEGKCTIYDYNGQKTSTVACAQELSYGGPMVGFGMEWRF
ncbi:MAG: hypothetical protein HY897_10825 [Deltaproteobacteria bacterium]|nr:hypothetical protein [Deltaproteobacteria bacterium]